MIVSPPGTEEPPVRIPKVIGTPLLVSNCSCEDNALFRMQEQTITDFHLPSVLLVWKTRDLWKKVNEMIVTIQGR